MRRHRIRLRFIYIYKLRSYSLISDNPHRLRFSAARQRERNAPPSDTLRLTSRCPLSHRTRPTDKIAPMLRSRKVFALDAMKQRYHSDTANAWIFIAYLPLLSNINFFSSRLDRATRNRRREKAMLRKKSLPIKNYSENTRREKFFAKENISWVLCLETNLSWDQSVLRRFFPENFTSRPTCAETNLRRD